MTDHAAGEDDLMPEERVGEGDVPSWQKVVSLADNADCESFSSSLAKAAETVTTDNAALLRVLAEITSMALAQGARMEPLKPRWTTPAGRSAIPEDLSDQDLDVLSEALPSIGHADLAARICDVLWTRRRRPAHAEQAIDAYLNAATQLEDQWAAWLPRVERALAFASVLRDRERGTRVIEYLKSKLEQPRASRLVASVLELLLKLDGDAERYAKHAEECAAAAATARNILQEREFYELAAAWHRENGDADAERRCRLAEAETYVAGAERASDADTALFMKAHFFEQAIEALRRVGKCKERVTELHHKLLVVQARIPATMRHFEGPKVDLTETALEAMSRLDGCDFREALLRLALMVSPPSYEETRRQAQQLAKEHPLSHLFRRQRVNEKGQVVFAAPGADSDPSEASEEALLASMYEQCDTRRGIYATGVINPASSR